MNIAPYLKLMAEKNASDLFFTTGAPACVKIEGDMKPVSRTALEPGLVKRIAYSVMDENQIKVFEEIKEMNLGLSLAASVDFVSTSISNAAKCPWLSASSKGPFRLLTS